MVPVLLPESSQKRYTAIVGIEQVLTLLGVREAYFWRTHQGAEFDLFVVRGGKRYGFEMKMSDAAMASKSTRIAIDDLKLNRLFVLYPGRQSYSIDRDIEALSILDMPSRLADLK